MAPKKGPMALLIDILGEIPDPRRGNAQRHDLLDILTIALVASARLSQLADMNRTGFPEAVSFESYAATARASSSR